MVARVAASSATYSEGVGSFSGFMEDIIQQVLGGQLEIDIVW
jgi:hypothetical protein